MKFVTVALSMSIYIYVCVYIHVYTYICTYTIIKFNSRKLDNFAIGKKYPQDQSSQRNIEYDNDEDDGSDKTDQNTLLRVTPTE